MERMETGETEMGRKPIVPYGLYRAHGFYNPFLAEQTGVSREDLELFWEALTNMFEFDRSAARGEMAVRGLWVFTHENSKGNAPAHKLFDLIHAKIKAGVVTPRGFEDYDIEAPGAELGKPLDLSGKPYEIAGVTLTRLV
jgi:CRISPR-associated protein Csd2